MKRPSVNITPIERGGRMFMGVLGVIGGVVLLSSSAGTWTAILAVLLVLAGLDLLITGALGHCPLYRKLGYVPQSLRRSS